MGLRKDSINCYSYLSDAKMWSNSVVKMPDGDRSATARGQRDVGSVSTAPRAAWIEVVVALVADSKWCVGARVAAARSFVW